MNKIIIFLALAITITVAEPKPSGVLAAAPFAVAPAVAPAFVTAQSSQVVARNYNALVAAPVVAAPAPVVAAAAPYVAAPAPVVAASYKFGFPAVASPYVANPYLAAPAPLIYG